MTTNAPPPIPRIVHALCERLNQDRIGTGPLAMLRRLDPSRVSAEPALHRVLAECHPDLPEDVGQIMPWTLIVLALALAAPDRFAPRAGLGRPLFEAGLKEGRMTRLLEARRDELPVVVPRAVRFLVARGGRLDPAALAYFVLDLSGGSAERADKQRMRVARDYFRAARDAESPAASPAATPA